MFVCFASERQWHLKRLLFVMYHCVVFFRPARLSCDWSTAIGQAKGRLFGQYERARGAWVAGVQSREGASL